MTIRSLSLNYKIWSFKDVNVNLYSASSQKSPLMRSRYQLLGLNLTTLGYKMKLTCAGRRSWNRTVSNGTRGETDDNFK